MITKAPHNSTSSKFNTLHLNARRSSRPIKVKALKSVRRREEGEAAAAAADVERNTHSSEKLRLLTKLLARQTSQGKAAAAAATQESIDALMLG